MTQAIPEGFHSITPTLVLSDAKGAIEFYKKALGAKEDYAMTCPESGKIMHACLTIGDSKLFLSDDMPNCGGVTKDSRFYLYVKDCDAGFKIATAAGCSEIMKPEDMFWGDRVSAVKDKFGLNWTIATHVKEVSEEEMKKGRDAWMEKMKSGKANKAA